ncbi:SET and MYND domain-containing protein [Angomonas deanei]|uniref:SET domain/MYND finger containing protein, putative n=1 Tax=Angomonas deanei TaxID=59799 RepID=A0A7G2CJP5_9TRYP|nr:SET and MYND domain-containing protein [Angomonas deanei]CAD2220016.1 SET domain/MYND finger containing protein, putative [Angomonas deanei]|eukprot:EPY32331.1 SET and MYND domain-containing protein [Angomonas deanei]
MTRIHMKWVRHQASKEMDLYMKQKAWNWCLKGNFGVAADYSIRLLNKNSRDPLSLLMGEVCARFTNQPLFEQKCRESQKRLCDASGVPNPFMLLKEDATPSRSEVMRFCEERLSGDSPGTGDEIIVVRETDTFANLETAVRRCAKSSESTPLVLVLEPRNSTYGRGLYANRRISSRTLVLSENPIFVHSSGPKHCAHCLAPLDGVPVECVHCKKEFYCSKECQENAWKHYHACSCESHNREYAQWASGMKDTLSRGHPASPTAPDARAALACLAVSKLCAMATMRQCYPLTLTGVSSLRGTAEYDPATALDEIGNMAISLASAFNQTHLFMEEVLSLFALVQTNEFLLSGGMAVYQCLSLLNHSCQPNCKVVSSNGASNTQLIALKDIREGEQLFIDYNAALMSPLSYEDRKSLCAQRHFECYCPKCIRRE